MEVGRLRDATEVKNPDDIRIVNAAITLWILVLWESKLFRVTARLRLQPLRE
ncbi:MAG: hypothetical protein ACYCOR_11820 [Acidobacteriaceae bacterium]